MRRILSIVAVLMLVIPTLNVTAQEDGTYSYWISTKATLNLPFSIKDATPDATASDMRKGYSSGLRYYSFSYEGYSYSLIIQADPIGYDVFNNPMEAVQSRHENHTRMNNSNQNNGTVIVNGTKLNWNDNAVFNYYLDGDTFDSIGSDMRDGALMNYFEVDYTPSTKRQSSQRAFAVEQHCGAFYTFTIIQYGERHFSYNNTFFTDVIIPGMNYASC